MHGLPFLALLVILVITVGGGIFALTYKYEEVPSDVVVVSQENVSETPDTAAPETAAENKLLTILEGEIDQLIEDGVLIEFDHYKKLRARLDALEGTGDKKELARVDEKLLLVIEPEELAANTPPPQTDNKLLTELEGEIDQLIEDGVLIGIDHHEKLRARLDAFAGTEDKGVIARIDEKLIFLIEPAELAVGTSSPGAPERTCVSNTNPVFTNDITDVWRISQITPPGNISSDGGVTSHSYIDIADGKQVPVYAPVDMRLGNGAFYIENGLLGYILWFQVSCEVTIKFDHIAEPVDAIKIAFPSEPQIGTRDNILNEDGNAVLKAGDLIGHTSGTSQAHNWDFGVYNTSIYPNPVTLGIANLDDLDRGADCGYDYFSSELRQAYRDLFAYDASMGSLGIIPYCSL